MKCVGMLEIALRRPADIASVADCANLSLADVRFRLISDPSVHHNCDKANTPESVSVSQGAPEFSCMSIPANNL